MTTFKTNGIPQIGRRPQSYVDLSVRPKDSGGDKNSSMPNQNQTETTQEHQTKNCNLQHQDTVIGRSNARNRTGAREHQPRHHRIVQSKAKRKQKPTKRNSGKLPYGEQSVPNE
ncbi:hypothetical protein ILUMI_26887 [Ignelater luminosus]|uniref:Uncharacterized protein n=1 Tax=Ignelater luminosus TaxID=2038154 RepID=A0A8K0C5X3_IGNLU|nr:hypothetical protein ILUMI_26887 [Ignelater luminosus]